MTNHVAGCNLPPTSRNRSSNSASHISSLNGIPNARLMRARLSIVGTRRLVSMKLIICRESRVISASRFSDNPLASRRCRMTFANASHTGSSAVRGNGLLCAVNGTGFSKSGGGIVGKQMAGRQKMVQRLFPSLHEFFIMLRREFRHKLIAGRAKARMRISDVCRATCAIG